MREPANIVSLSSGTRLGAYEILTLIGSGGMGEVYKSHDARLGRDVAIKVLPAAFSADRDRLDRFKQEARAAAALNHPNILTVHEIGSHDGCPYLVFELLDGQTLRDALQLRALPVRKAVEYAAQIANGLAAAHASGVVHRDLKPENIFVTKDGRVKILDFGLAKLVEVAPPFGDAVWTPTVAYTTPGTVLGTVGYMSPEQVRGEAVDHRSDIFSFGAIVYEMLSGERAFTAGTPAETISAILTSEPPSLRERSAAIPESLDHLIRQCVEKSPDQRFQSTKDLVFALTNAHEPPHAHPAAISPRERYTWIVAVVGLMAVVAVLLAGQHRQPQSVRPSLTLVTTGRTTI